VAESRIYLPLVLRKKVLVDLARPFGLVGPQEVEAKAFFFRLKAPT
jgi:hypothetical protein